MIKEVSKLNRIIFALFGLFSFFLGTGHEKLTTLSLILLTTVSLLKIKKIEFKNGVTKFYVFFLIITIYALIYGEYKYIERNISLILFPILFLNLNKEFINKVIYRNFIVFSFSLGLLFYPLRIIIYYIISGELVETGAPLLWYNFYDLKRVLFSNNIFNYIFHNVYYSIYSISSILFLLSLIKNIKRKWIVYLLMVLHILFVYVAASRISYIIIFILIILYGLKNVNNRKRIYLLLTTTISLIVFYKIILNNKYSYLYHKLIEDLPNAFLLRQKIWMNSLNLFSENLMGLGFKNFHSELDILNSNTLPQELLTVSYNSHNLFLEYFCALGVIGGLYFIYLIYSIFRRAYINKNKVLFCLITTLSICFLTESLLLRQYGIVFFMFSITLFWKNEKPIT